MTKEHEYAAALEFRRMRAGIPYEDLAQRARVPFTRMYYVLVAAHALKPDERARIERVLEAVEHERGY